MKIALIGADGQLGSDLAKILKGSDLVPLYYPEFDITQAVETRSRLTILSPDIIINTAAYHKVDECEDNPAEAFALNALAVRELALTCRALDSVLVHFSTDYVFDGKKGRPYDEEDMPNPLSTYAVSKLAGEYYVRNVLARYFLIRTCGLYGEAGCWGKGSNFVETMINMMKQDEVIRVVNDQRVSPTATSELAERIVELLQTDFYGLYHLTSEGDCTWYEFAEAIFSQMNVQVNIKSVDSAAFGAKAKRPPYSVLDNKQAKIIGLSPFSHWKDALTAYLKKKGHMA
jgi:dTDP-4-dehydrorhamnose reductase